MNDFRRADHLFQKRSLGFVLKAKISRQCLRDWLKRVQISEQVHKHLRFKSLFVLIFKASGTIPEESFHES